MHIFYTYLNVRLSTTDIIVKKKKDLNLAKRLQKEMHLLNMCAKRLCKTAHI